jgi:predicted chitinase
MLPLGLTSKTSLSDRACRRPVFFIAQEGTRMSAIAYPIAASVFLGVGLIAAPSLAAAAKSAPAGTCPTISAYVSRLSDFVPDLGGGDLVDEDDRTVEPLGSKECPVAGATQCEKLTYMSFMLSLMDMSPKNYRRPGIAAFLANVSGEDSSLGANCSAERLNYGSQALRKSFGRPLRQRFCSAGAAGYSTARAAGIVAPNGDCDTTDSGLDKLKNQIMTEVPPDLARRPEFSRGYGPIVNRIYMYKFSLASDADAFGFRGRGFIQITGKQSYADCQADISKAAAYMKANSAVAKQVTKKTGVDWVRLNVVQTPSEVSHNLYVGAFCAASFWNSHVAPKELTWADPETNFHRLTNKINTDDSVADRRYPSFSKWCGTVKCQSNVPAALNFGAFSELVKRRN